MILIKIMMSLISYTLHAALDAALSKNDEPHQKNEEPHQNNDEPHSLLTNKKK